jgi:hypothetical protein
MARERHYPDPPWGIMHGTDSPPPAELYPPRLVWIEGRIRINTEDDLFRDMMQEAYPLLIRLGFQVHEQMITVEDDISTVPQRRRFTPTNIPLEHVIATVSLDPGHDDLYYAEELFKGDLWNEFTQAAARNRFRQAARRAGTTKIRKFWTRGGKVLYGPPNWEPPK